MYLFSNHFGIYADSFCLKSVLYLTLSLSEGGVESLCNLVDEFEGVEVLVAGWRVSVVHANGQVLGHEAGLDCRDNCGFHGLAEVLELSVRVEFGSVEKTTGPGEHGCNRVGGCLTTLLVDTVMSGDGAVGSFGLNRAVGGLKDRGHETEGAVALSDNIGLDITVVVLASPDVAAARLDGVGNHIIDETVLVPKTSSLKLGLVFGIVDFLEDILEATIVLLQDSVFGCEVAGVVSGKSVLHAGVGEAVDGLVGVVHAKHDTSTLELIDFEVGGLRAIGGGESHRELSWDFGAEVGGSVLISKGVSADNDGLVPAWHQLRDVADNNGLSEDRATNDVTDGTVGGLPHLFEAKFSHTSLVRGDSCALDANFAGLDSLCGVNSDLIVGLITVLNAQVEIVDVQVQMREDQLVLDQLPDDSGHLITVEFGNGLSHLDFVCFSHR